MVLKITLVIPPPLIEEYDVVLQIQLVLTGPNIVVIVILKVEESHPNELQVTNLTI
jgi:hypothetical protein